MVVKLQKDEVFASAYQRWLEEHIRNATGERKRRLLQGLGHSEKLFIVRVWWPAFGNLDHLHPEFEMYDFKDGSRFLDFAYIKDGLMLCIEIDAFGTHHSKLSRWQFDDNLDRQNDLVLDDWKVLRFSTDQVTDNPRHCQQKIRLALGKWGAVKSAAPVENPIDHAIVKLLESRGTALSPIEIARVLQWSNRTIAKHLKTLSEDKIVLPVKPGLKRISRYILNRSPKR